MNQIPIIPKQIGTMIALFAVTDYILKIPVIRFEYLDKRTVKGHEAEIMQQLEADFRNLNQK